MLSDVQRLKMLEPPKGIADMVLDTDAFNEIDDQFAISYAVHAPEKLSVKAFYAAPFLNERSTSPTDGMEKSYHEIRKVLKIAGKEEYPVFRGSKSYLPDEKTPVQSDAMQDLIERAMTYSPEHPLYVVCIAAITDIASALLTRPEIADKRPFTIPDLRAVNAPLAKVHPFIFTGIVREQGDRGGVGRCHARDVG